MEYEKTSQSSKVVRFYFIVKLNNKEIMKFVIYGHVAPSIMAQVYSNDKQKHCEGKGKHNEKIKEGMTMKDVSIITVVSIPYIHLQKHKEIPHNPTGVTFPTIHPASSLNWSS